MFWVSLKIFIVISLLFVNQAWSSCPHQHRNVRSFGNEDIRVAIFRIEKKVNAAEKKLDELKEYEYNQDNQIKRGLFMIDKGMKKLNPSDFTKTTHLDEYMNKVKIILKENQAQEGIQLERTFNMVQNTNKNLPIIIEILKNDVINKLSNLKMPAAVAAPVDTISKKDFDLFQANLNNQLMKMISTMSSVEKHLNKIEEKNKNMKEINNILTKNVDKINNQLNAKEQLLEKCENKLTEYNNKTYKEQNDWQAKFMQSLNVQKTQVEQILSGVKATVIKVNALPSKSELENVQNQSVSILQEIKYENAQQPEKCGTILDGKIKTIQNDIDQKHDEILQSINNRSEVTNVLTKQFLTSNEQLLNEIQNLAKIENDINNIFPKVSQLMIDTSKYINFSMNERFDNLEMSVFHKDTGALTNLTTKIGQKIDHVIQQTEIVNKQINANTDILNKLQIQTDIHKKDFSNTLDKIKTEVVKLDVHITVVDKNLDLLQNKIPLITEEVIQTKSSLEMVSKNLFAAIKSIDDKLWNVAPEAQ